MQIDWLHISWCLYARNSSKLSPPTLCDTQRCCVKFKLLIHSPPRFSIDLTHSRPSSSDSPPWDICECITHSLQALETWAGTVYLQSMIMVRVSLSLASWNGGWPHTNMKRMTPRLQISAAQGTKSEQHVPYSNNTYNVRQCSDALHY